MLQTWNDIRYNLSRTGSNTFQIPDNPGIQFTFSEPENGIAQKLTVLQNGNETVASRLPETDLSRVDPEEYVGAYYSREIDATYQVYLEGDDLKVKTPDGIASDVIVTDRDEFIAGRLLIEFKRSEDVIKGFDLDAGRVQNLKFEKK
jgi:hypothetical protein